MMPFVSLRRFGEIHGLTGWGCRRMLLGLERGDPRVKRGEHGEMFLDVDGLLEEATAIRNRRIGQL